MSDLTIFNSLSGKKEVFLPIDNPEVKLYVCGPTVYDTPHIGNIRSAVVYDIVFRVLRHTFARVKYVRNITDVDDKIIKAASDQKKSVEQIALFYEEVFHKNLDLLNCLHPTIEPRATESIPAMIKMIDVLIKNGSAYVAGDHVYFEVSSFKDYGKLSGKKLEDLIHGARVEASESKKHPGDFVLWKPDEENGWQSPWGTGRPGWHIECSAMSNQHLGSSFDIHGGGADLKFPHHENEIAQSRCANKDSLFAKYWIHNGFLTVGGQKMSKSIGNVVTVEDLVAKNITPNIIRLVLIATHYRKPLDWNDAVVSDAKNALVKFKFALNNAQDIVEDDIKNLSEYREFFAYLLDDFNTPGALTVLHKVADLCSNNVKKDLYCSLLGHLMRFIGLEISKPQLGIKEEIVKIKINDRNLLRSAKRYKEADQIRQQLESSGVFLKDEPGGKTCWIAL